jgi:hypothetical protein
MALPATSPSTPSAPTHLIWTNDSGETDFIEFDVVTSQSHEANVAITEHPVEVGLNVVDYARPEPERLSIEAFISNHPLASNPGANFESDNVDLDLPDKPVSLSLVSAVNAVGDALFGATKYSASITKGDGSDRGRIAYEKLLDVKNKARRVRVVTTLVEYDDMMIERLTAPRAVEDGAGLSIQIDLKHIRTVTALTVDAPQPAEKRGEAQASKGSKAGKDDKSPAKKRSILAGLLGIGAE